MEEMVIIAIKLTSGEELIASVVDKGNEFELHNARSIMLVPGGQLRLAPLLFSAAEDRPIMLSKASIAVSTSEIRSEFRDSYVQSTSKLVVPKSSILMG